MNARQPLRPRPLLLLALAALLAGCATYPANVKLDRHDPAAGYRYQNLSTDGNTDELLVILAFSGGGTRAAAFSLGVLEALRDATYRLPTGTTRRLLDDVDVISSVSGGSFTAAYYAAFGERVFTHFPDAFLHENVEARLLERVLWPPNWLRLASPRFDRIHLAAELHDEAVFEGKTFGDLIRAGRKPFLVLNATDMLLGQRFEFTQDQLDLLCSDLGPVKIATAVAASSAFPGLLSPLTLRNFAPEGCQYRRPTWLTNALVRDENPVRRYARARDLWSYQDPDHRGDYVHLLDGGLADNIGLRGPYVALSSQDSGWSVLTKINQGRVRRVVVIAANAKTKPRKDWDQRASAPGLLGVLGFVASGPMDNYSFDTVQLVRDFFTQQTLDARALEDCKALLQQACPAAQVPGVLPPVDFHAIELSFDAVEDEGLRLCLENLPTSFKLPRSQVALLRQVAGGLVSASADFRRLMLALDPRWQATAPQVTPQLMSQACQE